MGKSSRSIPNSSRTIIYIPDIATILPDDTVAGVDDCAIPDFREQTSTILATIENVIKGASGGRGLIDALVYLNEMERDYAGMNEEWNKVFVSQSAAPARATIGLKHLPASW